MLSKKGLSLICVSVVVTVSVALVIAKNGLKTSVPLASASFEKTGKIKKLTFVYPIPRDCCSLPLTCVEYEDGSYIQYYGILDNIKEGKAYHIVYEERDRICCKDDSTYTGIKISTINVVQEIEEISP
jgi:hypothetical protein